MKKFKNIILKKRRTTVELSSQDNWLVSLRYLVNKKITYECQIIMTDLPGRIEKLQKEGFKKLLCESNPPDNGIM